MTQQDIDQTATNQLASIIEQWQGKGPLALTDAEREELRDKIPALGRTLDGLAKVVVVRHE